MVLGQIFSFRGTLAESKWNLSLNETRRYQDTNKMKIGIKMRTTYLQIMKKSCERI